MILSLLQTPPPARSNRNMETRKPGLVHARNLGSLYPRRASS